MIFKSRALVSLAAILMLSSCSKFLDGKPNKPEFIEVQNEKMKCVADMSTKLKQMLTPEFTTEDIDKTFACLDSALAEFQIRANGSEDKNSFTTEDVYQIFSTFIKEAQVSQKAAADILSFKSAILGGDEQKFTKIEISRLREFLKFVKPEVHALHPYRELLTFKKATKTIEKTAIEEGFKQLEVSLKKILNESKLARSDYRFDEFIRLIEELKVVPDDQASMVSLAIDVKNLLTGSYELKDQTDYDSVLESFVQILKLHSFHTQGHVVFEIKTPEILKDSFDFLDGWLHLLQNSVQFKKNGLISTETLDPFIAKMTTQKILPVSVQPETLKAFYKTILVRIFDKGLSGDISAFQGLRKNHFTLISQELDAFKLYMTFIDSVDFSKGRVSIASLQESLKKYSFTNAATKISHNSSERSTLVSYVHELQQEFLSARPVVYRFNKMVIAVNQEIWDQTWEDLARGAFVKFLSRELMIGWGNAFETRLVANAKLTEANLVKWYAEFKQFGIESKAFDQRAENSGARSFKEANLFSYAADGNDSMNFLETLQYLNILTSGGGRSFSEVKDGFALAGCNIDKKDIFDNPWNNEDCAFKDFRKNYKYYFNNLSYLVGFLSRLSEAEFAEFYNEAMDVARISSDMKGNLETGDLRTFIILLHYIEATYAQFDVDRNWTFSHNEIRWAYPRFKVFATDFAHQTSQSQLDLFNLPFVQVAGYGCYAEEDLVQESFIFLVYNGRTPTIKDLNIMPCLGKRSLIDFQGEVDRKTMIKTFKILKAVLGS